MTGKTAYATQIKIYDEDGELIGTLNHTIDDVFTFTPVEDSGAFASDYKFIAKVLDSDLCNIVITEK